MNKKTIQTDREKSEHFARFIVEGAQINQERVGKRLLESLRAPVASVVRGTDFNPKYIDDMSYDDVVQWLENYVVFDHKGDQVAVFDGTDWVWEAGHHG